MRTFVRAALLTPGAALDQAVWEPLTNTLHFESDEQLAQRARYLLVVTDEVRGADGRRLDVAAFWRDLARDSVDPAVRPYRISLLLGFRRASVPSSASGS